MDQPISTKPYLLRAIYEWCADSGLTPYLAVVVNDECRVPLEFVKDGEIVLNVGPSATPNLTIDNEWISFNARFGGVAREIFVPIGAVIGIYAMENGQGLFFGREEVEVPPVVAEDSSSESDGGEPRRGKPSLTVVK